MYLPHNAPPLDPQLLADLTKQQNEMRQQVKIQPLSGKIKTIAGCDSSLIGNNILSVFILLSYPKLEILEKVWHYAPLELPYIPGFLAFREAPNLLKAYEKLQTKPDLIMVDGHGMAHPRRMGIATHLGVLLNKPTMGVAKKILVGKFDLPPLTKGSHTPVMHKGEHIANVLCTKDNIKPIFVSPGHLTDMKTATDMVMKTVIKHKLPEPTRYADHYAEVFKSEVEK